MLFPSQVLDKFEKTFYDKDIILLDTTDTLDAEGGVVRNSTTKLTFKGNVKFNNLGETMTELGLTESIDICITCRPNEVVKVNDLAKYDGKTYQLTSVIPADSHLTITGKLWPKQ